MSAITLVNEVPLSTAPQAEFRVSDGAGEIARIAVPAGGEARVPTHQDRAEHVTPVQTDLPWSFYGIVQGITTQAVKTSNPNGVIRLKETSDGGFELSEEGAARA
ncbi:MAG: hypothetical protein JOZ54_10390 [Acidobacteria bacterium]|nr:hypothetical protein [Acidobacteriota bacterium]